MVLKPRLSDNESRPGYCGAVESRLTIEKLVSGGLGLARDEHGVLFVEGVLPGEVIVPQPPRRIHGVRHTRPAAWVTESPDRREPPCSVHHLCGGCGLQQARDAAQSALKASWVSESIRRLGRWDPPALDLVTGPMWAYRCRIQVHWDGQRAGFLGRRSTDLVPTRSCPVSLPPLEEWLNPDHPFWKGRLPGRYTLFTDGKRVFPQTEAWAGMRLGDRELWVHPGAFFQANLTLTVRLRDWLVDRLASPTPAHLWDLYAGVGTWSQPLAWEGWKVTLVESDTRVAPHARRNCPTADVLSIPVEEFLQAQDRAPEVVIVDPPRAGLSASVRADLVRLRPARLFYIGCDADTFARDGAALIQGGYSPRYLGLWDFYPQTPHVEIVSEWGTG